MAAVALDKKALWKSIEADERAARKRRLEAFRKALREASKDRKRALEVARSFCRAERLAASERNAAMRLQMRADANERAAAERAAARASCASNVSTARAPVLEARAALEAERKRQKEARAIDASAKRRKPKAPPRASVARAESDDEVRQNIAPELQALFERVKRSIKGSARKSRTEAFLEYAEAHPDEWIGAVEDQTDALIARREAELRAQADDEDISFPFGANAVANPGRSNPREAITPDPDLLWGANPLRRARFAVTRDGAELRDDRGVLVNLDRFGAKDAKIVGKWLRDAAQVLSGRLLPGPMASSKEVARFVLEVAEAMPRVQIPEYGRPWEAVHTSGIRDLRASVYEAAASGSRQNVFDVRDADLARAIVVLAELTDLGEKFRSVRPPRTLERIQAQRDKVKKEGGSTRAIALYDLLWGLVREAGGDPSDAARESKLAQKRAAKDAKKAEDEREARAWARVNEAIRAAGLRGEVLTGSSDAGQTRYARLSDGGVWNEAAPVGAGETPVEAIEDFARQLEDQIAERARARAAAPRSEAIARGRRVAGAVRIVEPEVRPAGYGDEDAKRRGQLRMFNPSNVILGYRLNYGNGQVSETMSLYAAREAYRLQKSSDARHGVSSGGLRIERLERDADGDRFWVRQPVRNPGGYLSRVKGRIDMLGRNATTVGASLATGDRSRLADLEHPALPPGSRLRKALDAFIASGGRGKQAEVAALEAAGLEVKPARRLQPKKNPGAAAPLEMVDPRRGELVSLGLLTRLVYKGASGPRVLSWALRSAPILAYHVCSDPKCPSRGKLAIVYRDGRPSRRSSDAGAREYRRTHWGEAGQGRAVSGLVAGPGGRFAALGPVLEVTYTTRKGADGAATDYVHAMGEGGRGPFVPPILGRVAQGGTRAALLVLAGGSYRVTERGIVG